MAKLPPAFKASASFVRITVTGNLDKISMKRKQYAELEKEEVEQKKQVLEQQNSL